MWEGSQEDSFYRVSNVVRQRAIKSKTKLKLSSNFKAENKLPWFTDGADDLTIVRMTWLASDTESQGRRTTDW